MLCGFSGCGAEAWPNQAAVSSGATNEVPGLLGWCQLCQQLLLLNSEVGWVGGSDGFSGVLG